MTNKPNSPESADSTCMAYGQMVNELLSASSADTWCDHLWAMYGGYVLAQKERGYGADAPNVFWSFRDLLFFFQELALRHAQGDTLRQAQGDKMVG